MRASIPVAAAVAAVVGFGGTLAIILSAAAALGASQAETASWVTRVPVGSSSRSPLPSTIRDCCQHV